MAEAVTQASLWGGPLIPFHRPQPSLLPLCGLQHHTAPTEKSSISGWQRYHGRRDDEKALGSCAAAISDKCASDKCASVHAANLSHVKHIPAEWKRHILTAKLNAHTPPHLDSACGILERCTLSLYSWQPRFLTQTTIHC